MKGCVWRHPSRWGGLLLWLLLLPLCCTAETAAGERGGELSGLSAEDRINLLCLRSAYPQIRAVESGPDGIWLRLEGERRVLYASAAELAAHPYDDATLLDREQRLARRLDPARMDVSLRASMHLPYLPDPERAATPLVGRRREGTPDAAICRTRNGRPRHWAIHPAAGAAMPF